MGLPQEGSFPRAASLPEPSSSLLPACSSRLFVNDAEKTALVASSTAAPAEFISFLFCLKEVGSRDVPTPGSAWDNRGPSAETRMTVPTPHGRGRSARCCCGKGGSLPSLQISSVKGDLPPPKISCHLIALQSNSGRARLAPLGRARLTAIPLRLSLLLISPC